MKYRKKPVVIEAEQLTWANWSAVCDMIGDFPENMQGVAVDPNGKAHSEQNYPGHLDEARIGLIIPTLEGTMLGVEGDWIIKGVQGEFYPCKPDIFEATYEKVDD